MNAKTMTSETNLKKECGLLDTAAAALPTLVEGSTDGKRKRRNGWEEGENEMQDWRRTNGRAEKSFEREEKELRRRRNVTCKRFFKKGGRKGTDAKEEERVAMKKRRCSKGSDADTKKQGDHT